MDNIFQKYFQDKVISIRDLKHKGNNQLFEVTTENRKYLLKRYSTIQKDNWNRGETEFRAISHFWNKGFREIPEPISFHPEENIAIYSFEEGKILESQEIKEQDIIQAANFLGKLHNLDIEDKKKFPLERTNCISILSYLKLIETRIKNISEDFSAEKEAKEFWDDKVCQKAKELKEFILKQNKELDKELSLKEQVITPGDFGFHNILVSPEKYTFIDFEFCGRDDPAKQILDFFHHDKTRNISRELKDLFLEQYKKCTNYTSSFEERLNLVDPLIGMNWVLIFLNPLSKHYQKHMQFAYRGDVDIKAIIQERLTKAENKLNNISYFNTSIP